MEIPKEIVQKAAAEIRGVDKQYVGLIIWRIARENCKNAAQLDEYKHALAQAVGKRGGEKYAKQLRQEKNMKQLTLDGVLR